MQNRLTDLTKSVVAEVVEEVETVFHADNEEQIMKGKPEVYLNQIISNEIDEFVEDIPVCDITEMILAYLKRDEDDIREYNMLVNHLKTSKAAAKAFLNRVFDFRRNYKRKEDGEVFFYNKKVGYPPANLVADLEYELWAEIK